MENPNYYHQHSQQPGRHIPDEIAIKSIEQIFSQFGSLKEQLKSAAALFHFMSTRIYPRGRLLEVPDEVAIRFESVCLWLRKVLPYLPPEVRDQAAKVLDETQVEHTIIALHSLGDEYRRALRYQNAHWFIRAIALPLGGFRTGLDDTTAEILREEKLQSTKVALTRLSSMLNYAADDLEQVEETDDFFYRNHYNPELVDRTRVLTLLKSLQEQLESLPENDIKKRLIANVEQLKQEAERPRPRWRAFIGKAVILLAIIADIKSVHPEIGDEILQTVDAVIQSIVTGCQVSPNQIPMKSHDQGPKHWAIEPKRIEFKPHSEDEGGVTR